MAKEYPKYTYIYPPRPEVKIPSPAIIKFDDRSMVAQPKFNGSNCTLYLQAAEFTVGNRHQGTIGNFKLKAPEILKLHTGSKGFRVVVGEYMNKSKKDATGKVWNDKFVIFDILVNDGVHLIGSTYEERLELLHDIYTTRAYNEYVDQITENCFLIKTFEGNFTALYNEVVKVDMLEGLVLKTKKAKLENGVSERNNQGWQLKARKSTKNYNF